MLQKYLIGTEKLSDKVKSREIFKENWNSPKQILVRKLSNWQRNQWAKAGYPENVGDFIKLKKC